MASTYYGYGCWETPYWFLGPEEGMTPNVNDLKTRVAAWRHFGGRELNDCREFHFYIGDTRWHGESAILQRTWGKLLLTLFAFSGMQTDKTGLRLDYQKHRWGFQSGETCVFELSGLAAHNLNVERDRESFLKDRIKHIHAKICEHRPEFVHLYGKTPGCKKAWKELTEGGEAIPDGTFPFAEFCRCGPTILAWTRHPVAFGPTNENWMELGT